MCVCVGGGGQAWGKRLWWKLRKIKRKFYGARCEVRGGRKVRRANTTVWARYLAREISKVLDISTCLRLARHYYLLKISWTFDEDEYSAQDVGFEYFNVIKRLEDFNGVTYSTDPAITSRDRAWVEDEGAGDLPTLEETCKRIEAETASVELVVEGVMQKIYFMVTAERQKQLRQKPKSRLLWSVDRTSNTDQVRDFVRAAKIMIADMKLLNSLMDRSQLARSARANRSRCKIVTWSVVRVLVIGTQQSFTAASRRCCT